MRQLRTPGTGSPAMPISTGRTSQWAVRAIWHTLVRPHGKVFGHGTGHFLPGLAHALRHHAVIRAEHHHHPAGKIKLRAAGKGGGILQHGLQPAQPAQRLCKAGPVGMCRRAGSFVAG